MVDIILQLFLKRAPSRKQKHCVRNLVQNKVERINEEPVIFFRSQAANMPENGMPPQTQFLLFPQMTPLVTTVVLHVNPVVED